VAHGLDLEAIRRRLNGHSIFAPSSSAMWLNCSGSLIPNLLAEDTAGEDAAYGTVGHDAGEQWLANYAFAKRKFGGPEDMLLAMSEPRDLLGEVRVIKEHGAEFHIEIDDEMLAYVRQYVEWCVALPGEHYVETQVDFSDLTPIPEQRGRADHAACSWQLLVISDLKMGKGIKVFAKDNSQGLLYAYGFFREWDWLYNFQRIVIRIAQPRLDHFDEWEITREELLDFAGYVANRAALAWTPDAPRSPSPKACQWCKVKADCAALAKWTHDATEDCFDDLDVIEGEYRVVTTTEMTSVNSAITDGWQPNPKEPSRLSTEALERLLPYRKLIEKWFSEIEAELEHRAMNGEELTRHKLVPGRAGRRYFPEEDPARKLLLKNRVPEDELYVRKLISPAKAEELLRTHGGLKKKEAAKLLDSVVVRPPSRQTLAPVSDERDALESPADVFDDLDDEL
jgi:hypothetical protein